MSVHRTFIANLQYPRFSGSPAFDGRADDIARAIVDSGADSAALNEAGGVQLRTLYAQAPLVRRWEYDRAQGRGFGVLGEGLNSVGSSTLVWDQPESRLSDYDLPSYGQWQRTSLGARLEQVDDPSAFAKLFAIHFAAKGSPLTAAAADRAKLAQVKYLRKKNGDSRVLWMGDFPRTGRNDDLRWLEREGYSIDYVSAATPLAVVSHGAVQVHRVQRYPHGSMFDHDYLVAEWSVTGKKEQA